MDAPLLAAAPSADEVLDGLVTPAFRVDADGSIGWTNAACARWFGVSARRLRGLGLEQLCADGALADAFARSAQQPVRLRRIGLLFPGTTETRFADLWLSPAPNGGRMVEAHPADEFPGEDPATALPAALSAALKGLAHELRNPLAGLKGAAQLLARRVEDPASLELTELIGSEVDRLTVLLDRLLTPAPGAPHAPLNLHTVLERVLRLAEAQAGWAVKLVRDYDPSLPALQGDADRLVQAVWNLVRNALEAGAANVSLRTRIERGVRIGEVLHARALRLDVGDDGRGVPEDLTERLFLPLVSGRAEGSGLGLALAQMVVREHGGSLGYRSRPGHTVFSVLLPVDEGAV